MKFKKTWGKSYPSCVKSWEENWDILSTFFAYPAEVRKIIYTTNIIEGLNRQFRSITKTKPSFTNDDSLRKMLYLASKKIVERWTVRCRNWDQVLNQLDIMFSEQNAEWVAFENSMLMPSAVIHTCGAHTVYRIEQLTNTGKWIISYPIRKTQFSICFLSVGICFYTKFYGSALRLLKPPKNPLYSPQIPLLQNRNSRKRCAAVPPR